METSTVTYVDPDVHTFVIKAVDGSGNRSGPSNAYIPSRSADRPGSTVSPHYA